MKAEAGELDLIEIHTKHTLKKFQPGKSKTKNKVWQFDPLHCHFLTLSPSHLCFCFCYVSVWIAAGRDWREVEQEQTKTGADQWKNPGVSFFVFAHSRHLAYLVLSFTHVAVERRIVAATVQAAPGTTSISPWRDPACRTWSLKMSCRSTKPLRRDGSLQVPARRRK